LEPQLDAHGSSKRLPMNIAGLEIFWTESANGEDLANHPCGAPEMLGESPKTYDITVSASMCGMQSMGAKRQVHWWQPCIVWSQHCPNQCIYEPNKEDQRVE
jgi:hypothetical protein